MYIQCIIFRLNALFWMSFSEIGLCHALGDIQFQPKKSDKRTDFGRFGYHPSRAPNYKIDDWMSFPEIGLAHAPEIRNKS